ncbi:MAG: Gfo/Idh/MocA family oxidoreductase [Spirochaetaceae bacterium]|nr:MAG: Gfo/Idh/MocA family oxidoreductase [Spirochaetaceae bacterium]
MKDDGKIRIGLIGTGWIGHYHGMNVLAKQDAELVGVFNPTETKVKAFAQRGGSTVLVLWS